MGALDQDSNTIFAATYDYRTRRVAVTEGLAFASPKLFRYDSGDSFQELTAVSGQPSALSVEFVRGSGMGGGIGSILYSDRGTNREHFAYNAVGHTVALTLSSGSVTNAQYYEAYGNIVASTGQSENNRLANTKERSFTLGLDNHGMRYFDPEIGRYISADPIGYGDGLNVYIYVHNNTKKLQPFVSLYLQGLSVSPADPPEGRFQVPGFVEPFRCLENGWQNYTFSRIVVCTLPTHNHRDFAGTGLTSKLMENLVVIGHISHVLPVRTTANCHVRHFTVCPKGYPSSTRTV